MSNVSGSSAARERIFGDFPREGLNKASNGAWSGDLSVFEAAGTVSGRRHTGRQSAKSDDYGCLSGGIRLLFGWRDDKCDDKAGGFLYDVKHDGGREQHT